MDEQGGLTAAVAAAGATPTTFVIDTAQTVSADLTIPATMTLVVLQGGSIAIASTKTLTMNGDFMAGDYQIITGSGTIAYNAEGIYPQAWVGGSGIRVIVADTQRVIFNAGSTQFQGAEGGDAEIHIEADNGDDDEDTWKIWTSAATSQLIISTYSGGSWNNAATFNAETRDMQIESLSFYGGSFTFSDALIISTGSLRVVAASGADAVIGLFSNAAAQPGDLWEIRSDASDGNFYIASYATGNWNDVLNLDQVTHNMTLSGPENADSTITLSADSNEDNPDLWRIRSDASDNSFVISSYDTGSWQDALIIGTSTYWTTIKAPNDADAVLELRADKGDQDSDRWHIRADTSDNNFYISSYASSTWSDVISIDDGTQTVTIQGKESTDGILNIYSDDGDDNSDRWRMRTDNGDSDYIISSYYTGSWTDILVLEDVTQSLTLKGPTANDAYIELQSDAGGQDQDKWRMAADASDNNFYLRSKTSGSWVDILTITNESTFTFAQDATINTGGLTVSSGSISVIAPEGTDAQVTMYADQGGDNSDKWRIRADASDGNFYISSHAEGAWFDVFRIDDTTYCMTAPSQTSFNAYPAAQQSNFLENKNVVVLFATEDFDQGLDFSSPTYTAPLAGKYQFNASLELGSMEVIYPYYRMDIVTTQKTFQSYVQTEAFTYTYVTNWTMDISVLADMAANDTAVVRIYANGTAGGETHDIQTASFFTGYLAH